MLDLTVIEKNYNCRVLDFLLLSAGRKIYKLQTNKGDFVLKNVNFPEAEFTFIQEACGYLAEQGCRAAAVVPKTDGGFCFEVPKGKRSERYFLMRYIDGKTADFSSGEDIVLLAEALAKLHQKSFGFHCEVFPDRNKIGDFADNVSTKINDMKKWQDCLKTKGDLEYFDFLYTGYTARYINLSLQVLESLQNYYGDISRKYESTGCICHHDLANHNILIDRSRTEAADMVGFVDFDYCIADVFVHDLASVLLRLGKENRYETELPLKFLEKYEEFLPLEDGERRLLWDYLRFPQGFWQLGLAFYEELPRMKDLKKQKIRKGRLDRRLTDYMDTAEDKHKFLQTLRSRIICGC